MQTYQPHRPSLTLTACMVLLFFGAACGNNDNKNPIKQQRPDMSSQDMSESDMSSDQPKDMIEDTSPDLPPDLEDMPMDMPPSAPRIAEAKLCDIPANPKLTVSPGSDLKKLTLTDPKAKCNDGSPGIMYISQAPANSPNANDWLIWLEGGGGCLDAKDCGDRWCGTQSPVYSAAKMSSKFAPAGITGKGIFARSPMAPAMNNFRGFNHVVLYYCSSDSWSGQKTHVVTDETNAYPPYELTLHGAHIVTAAIQTLLQGATSDDQSVNMPKLSEASSVLFMGTSAGGGGVRYNVDRVGKMIKATNPNVDYRAVVDAGIHLKADPPAISQETTDEFRKRALEIMVNFRGAVMDESCLALNKDAPELCADNTNSLINHTETPFFAKMDLSDKANTPGIYPDDRSYSKGVFDLLTSMKTLSTFSKEPISKEPGIFGPSCGHHVNLEVNAFYRIGIKTQMGTYNMHDVLWNWYKGMEPQQLIHNPNDGVTSVCP